MPSGGSTYNILNCRFIRLLCMVSFCVRIHLCIAIMLDSIACAIIGYAPFSVLVRVVGIISVHLFGNPESLLWIVWCEPRI